MTLFKTVRNRTKAQAAGRKLADRFAPSQTSYAATAAGKNLAIIDGRTVRAAGVDVATGTPISVVNAGSPGMASYSANGAGLAVQYAGGGGTGSGGGMEEHDLSSVWHTGTIADAQAPQFLKTDGSRQITGDLTVAAGIKIDGIDISAHAANPDAHHATATAVAPLAVSGQQVSLTLGHGVESSSSALRVKLPTNSGLARDTTGIYLAPSSLAVDSANAVSGSSHTHAITSSSNPGAAAAILATSAAGALTLSGTLQLLGTDASAQLHLRAATPGYDSYLYQDGSNLRLDVESLTSALLVSGGGIVTVTNRLATPLIVAAADLTINPAGDLTLNPGGGEIFIPGADTMRSEAWTSGVLGTGWGLQERGGTGRSHLDIRSIYCDELIATTFTADQVRVRSGSDWLGEALAIAARDNSDNKVTIPNVGGGAVRIYVEDVPEITGQIFDSNEYVLIKTINRSSGLIIRETWGRVSSYIAETGGRQSYSWTTVSGSGNFALEPGTALTGFGVSGGSYIFRTVIEAGRGPVERFATWVTNPYTPANRTSRVEIGDIKNAAGDSTTRYGIAAGNNLALTPTTGFSGLTVDSVNGVRIYNSDIGLYQSGAPVVTIERDAGIDLAAYTTLLPPDYIRQIAWWADLTSKTTPIARQWAAATGGNDYYNIHVDRPTGVSNYLFDVVVGNSAAGAQFVLTATPSPAYSTATLFADQILFSTTPKVGSFYASAATMWHADNDGTGSGLDADKLDSYHAAAFVLATDYEDSDVLTKVKNVDGASSGLDADLLDGYEGNQYALLASPTFTGTVGLAGDASNYYIKNITNGLELKSYSTMNFTFGAGSGSWTFANGNIVLANTGKLVFASDASNYYITNITDGLEIKTYGLLNFILGDSAGTWRFANGSVLMGTTSNPYSARLNVSGNIHASGVITAEDYFQIKQRSGAPSSASGWGRIYYDSGDDKLKYITSGGTVRTLSYT